MITWSDISNAATSTLVHPCWWRLDLWETQLCEPASKKYITMKTNTLHVTKCPQDIGEGKYMPCGSWTCHSIVWHYMQLWSIHIPLTVTCKETKETKKTCVVHVCLQCKIHATHEWWDRAVQVEESWSMCEIDLQCIYISDEEPWVIEKFLDQKWNQPKDKEGLK